MKVAFETVLNLLRIVIRSIKLAHCRAKWRAVNSHNYTVIENVFAFDDISVGKLTYGIITVYRWGSTGEGLYIGNFCSIASGVKFILGGNHHTDTISTYPFSHYYDGGKVVATSKGPIVVEDDVWIGTDVLIMSGVSIGKGAVIAGGSVVTKDVEAYSVVGGNPAKILKKRFNPQQIDIIKRVNFKELNDKVIAGNLDLLAEKLSDRELEFISSICDKLQ